MHFDMTISTVTCPVLPQSLDSHAYACWTIGSSWRHAHQQNPTALYHIELPYVFESPGRGSVFTSTDKQFADDIALPLNASSLSGPHAASWQAALDKEHGVFDHHDVCGLYAHSCVPHDNRILCMKCMWKVKSSQEGLAACFKACWVMCG